MQGQYDDFPERGGHRLFDSGIAHSRMGHHCGLGLQYQEAERLVCLVERCAWQIKSSSSGLVAGVVVKEDSMEQDTVEE